MSQIDVVTEFVELSTWIITPNIVVDRQPMVDVGVGDPSTTCTWGEAFHDVVKLVLHSTKLGISSSSDGIPDGAIAYTSDSLGDGYFADAVGNVRSLSGYKVELAVATGGVLTRKVDGIVSRSEDFIANFRNGGACRRIRRYCSKSKDGLGALHETTTILLEAALVLALGWGQLLELERAPLDTAGQGNFGIARFVSVFAEPTLATVLDVVVGIVVILNVQDGPVGQFNGVDMTIGVVGVLDVGLEVGAINDLLELPG